MATRTAWAVGLAAGAVALGAGVWVVLRAGARVTRAGSTGPGARVHHRERLPAALQPFASWWEAHGEFELQVPVTGGVRTDAEQRELYAAGRTKPGTIVTDAPTAADSAHGHAGAGDLHPVRSLFANGTVATVYLGTEADPAARAEGLRRFGVLAAAAVALGYQSGRDFPRVDWPHVQVRGWRALPLAIPPVA